MSPAQLRKLFSELHEFKQTSLYEFHRGHFEAIYNGTIDMVINEPLKGPETLYAREGWIGEARAATLQSNWFELLYAQLEEAVRNLEF